MNAKLTDDAVAELPLHRGRAELLEEIMSTPVLDDRPVRTDPPRRRTTWLVPAAAAAAVVALVAGCAWLVAGQGPGSSESGVAAAPTVSDRVLLDAPGWTVVHVGDTDGVAYEKGDMELEITRYAADSYDGYVEDRRHIVDPPADGEPVEVLGLGGQLWAYGPRDHTTIRQVQDGTWLEIRASGMGKPAYLALLGRLRAVTERSFEASLPEEFVDAGERPASIGQILSEIHRYVDPLLPSGKQPEVTSDEAEPYQLGVDVAGAVACAWFDEFATATAAGDAPRAQRAADALATSRKWPVLQRMDASGGYPEVVWSLADEVVAGQVPDWYVDGLGCES